MGVDTYDQYWLDGRKLATKRMVIVPQQRKTKGILNPIFISIALVTYIISNQSLMTLVSKHLLIAQKVGGSLEINERSLISLVSANPAPEPSPASGRSATSGTNRVPPMNGSIFGKRSVNGLKIGSSQQKESAINGDNIQPQQQQQHDYSDSSIRSDSKSTTIEQKLQSSLKQKTSLNINHNLKDLRPTTSEASSEATNYKDIITDIIEEFLALNNESDPEEASVAFCRMIVYECSQMLSSRSRSISNDRRRKKIHMS